MTIDNDKWTPVIHFGGLKFTFIILSSTVKPFSCTMFFLVLLKNQGTKLLVPSKWIKDLKVKELLNYGVIYQRKIEYIVFYSPIITDEPDFALNTQQVFNENRSGCYNATILKPFGK